MTNCQNAIPSLFPIFCITFVLEKDTLILEGTRIGQYKALKEATMKIHFQESKQCMHMLRFYILLCYNGILFVGFRSQLMIHQTRHMLPHTVKYISHVMLHYIMIDKWVSVHDFDSLYVWRESWTPRLPCQLPMHCSHTGRHWLMFC